MLICSMLNMFEDFLHRSRNNTSLRIVLVILESLHCVGLSSSCLAVCKDGRVITLKNWLDSCSCSVFIYITLGTFRAINIVKSERMISSNKLRVMNDVSLSTLFCNFSTKVFLKSACSVISSHTGYRHEFIRLFDFSLKWRTYPDNNSKILSLLIDWCDSTLSFSCINITIDLTWSMRLRSVHKCCYFCHFSLRFSYEWRCGRLSCRSFVLWL
jgi:hypothetical protein